jgi:hypothetical protein
MGVRIGLKAMGGLMKIKQVGIVEKYVKIVLYPQSAPTIITHVDIPDNAVLDGIAVDSDPNVTTGIVIDTSVESGAIREFTCSGYEPCVYHIGFESTRLFIHGGDVEIFNARITHIEAYALSTNPENRSTLLIRLLCIGECEPGVWTERRSAY